MKPMKNPCASVVLVGHCGADGFLLKNAVARALPGAAIEMVDSDDALTRHIAPDRLILVNRVLGGDFASDSGLDLIRRLAGLPSPPRMMLVSNYPEAQAEAVAGGALPGFGKRHVYDEATVQLLKRACELPGPHPQAAHQVE